MSDKHYASEIHGEYGTLLTETHPSRKGDTQVIYVTVEGMRHNATAWFTPEQARLIANDLLRAAEAAEKPQGVE
jgi:hypothetical protein